MTETKQRRDYSSLLKISTVALLGMTGCEYNNQIVNNSTEKVNDTSSTHFSLNIPSLSELEQKVSVSSPQTENKQQLLKQAEYGQQVYRDISLFLANYTLGVSYSWSSYRFEHQDNRKADPSDLEMLRIRAHNIRYNNEINSADTLKRCTAAEELYGIMKKAEHEKHLDEISQVIGYIV